MKNGIFRYKSRLKQMKANKFWISVLLFSSVLGLGLSACNKGFASQKRIGININHVRSARVIHQRMPSIANQNNRQLNVCNSNSKNSHDRYIKSHPKHRSRYTTVNNQTPDLLNHRWESFGTGRKEQVRSVRGPKVTFKTVRFLPEHVGGTHFIQSINVTPDGHYAYLGCDAYPYLSGYTKVAKVNMNTYRLKVGHRFYGGHGQALAYNPTNNTLWLLVDTEGPLNHGWFDEIGTHSLKPIRKVRFNVHYGDLGDSLAFDYHNHVYNENRIWFWDANRKFKNGSIVLSDGIINHKHVRFHLIKQGIRHAPGYIIQGIAYNPRNRKLYIETDDALLSIPVSKLGRLRPKDVKDIILNRHRECEGITFDRKGYAYILMARPNELLKSTRPLK